MPLDPRRLIPEPGWYRMSLTRDGVDVPVKVWETGERDPETGDPLEDITLHVAVNNVENRADKLDFHLERVALYGTPITEEEYRFMVDDVAWAETHEPEGPKANPRKPVDLSKVKSLF